MRRDDAPNCIQKRKRERDGGPRRSRRFRLAPFTAVYATATRVVALSFARISPRSDSLRRRLFCHRRLSRNDRRLSKNGRLTNHPAALDAVVTLSRCFFPRDRGRAIIALTTIREAVMIHEFSTIFRVFLSSIFLLSYPRAEGDLLVATRQKVRPVVLLRGERLVYLLRLLSRFIPFTCATHNVERFRQSPRSIAIAVGNLKASA